MAVVLSAASVNHLKKQSMKEILSRNELALRILGDQKSSEYDLRLTRYCFRIPCDEGELWYNSLTGEIILLNYNEIKSMTQEMSSELLRRWFLVSEKTDEYTVAKQLKKISSLMTPQNKTITNYVIFTTTDCNARCFYCYELGRSRMHMSKDTAHDVAKYIKKNSRGEKVSFQWFGGEPLYNYPVIDIICGELRESGIEYSSIMVTNGYLFDEDLVKKAIDEWHLEAVQISIDGTEEVYNQSKAYIYREGSAFQRVMLNIRILLDAGIKVQIRLNMDSKNSDDLNALADELTDRFLDENGLKIYSVLLRDFGHKVNEFESDDRALIAKKQLQEKLLKTSLGKRHYLKRETLTNQCMADNDISLTILPDGRIGKCEHESEEKLIGSIYSDEFDQKMIAAWKEVVQIPECRDCLLYPSCIRLKMCDWHKDGCTDMNRREMLNNLRQMVLNEYERYQKSADSTK